MSEFAKPFKKQIIEMIKRTWHTQYVDFVNGFEYRKFTYPTCPQVDGIGNKPVYYFALGDFESGVLDALAMGLNDLGMYGATPFMAMDHLMLPKDPYPYAHEGIIGNIINCLVENCIRREIALECGETALHTNLTGFELSISMLGFAKEPRINRFQVGDALIGIRSAGIHSNGFSEFGKLFGESFWMQDDAPPELINALGPTPVYLDGMLRVRDKYRVNGTQHVSGEAYLKLLDILPPNADAFITRNFMLATQRIFQLIYEEMKRFYDDADQAIYSVFNCGIGMIFSTAKPIAHRAADMFSDLTGIPAVVIGEIREGTGRVMIESRFSDRTIIL